MYLISASGSYQADLELKGQSRSHQVGLVELTLRRYAASSKIYTLVGLETMFKAHSEGDGHGPQTFRFMYMSGGAAERDQNKTPSWQPQYCLMRVSATYPSRAVTSSFGVAGNMKIEIVGKL